MIRKLVAPPLLLLTLAGCLSSDRRPPVVTPPAPTSVVRVEVFIGDPADEIKIPGATVRLDERPEPISRLADVAGNADFPPVPRGPRHLWVEADGFVSTDFHVELDEPLEVFRVSLVAQAPAIPLRTGIVRKSGNALVDDQGEFTALGATYFAAPWFYRHDRARLEKNLATLADAGVHFIRVLGEVGGEHWRGREILPSWPDYDQVVSGLSDLTARYGMRIQWSIWGETVESTSKDKRAALVDRFVRLAKDRPERILAFEIANEGWQNGFEGDAGLAELRDLTRRMRAKLAAQGTPILVAPTAPNTDNVEHENAKKLYDGLNADFGAFHFSRIINRAEGRWRPVRQPWEYLFASHMPRLGSDQEPIGVGSSVNSENDSTKIVGSRVVAHIAKLGISIFHSSAGVRGDIDFDQLPNAATTFAGLKAARAYLPANLSQWTRENHHWAGHPLTLDSPIWPDSNASEGVVRAYASHSGRRFIVAPIGVRNRVRFRAKAAMRIDVLDVLTGETLRRLELAGGESFELSGREAFVLLGEWR